MSRALTDKQYAALGRLAVEAAHLESIIEHFVADSITHDSEVSHLVLAGMPFDRRVALLMSILSVRLPDAPARQSLTPLLEESKRLMQDRNRYLHGLWETNAQAKTQVSNRRRKDGLLDVRTVSVEDLEAASHRLASVALRIDQAYTDMLLDIGAFELVPAGYWRRIPPHRPHGTLGQDDWVSQLVIDFSDGPEAGASEEGS